MKILFNSAILKHNVNSDIEGPYRISKFAQMLRETQPKTDGEELLQLTHTKSYIDKIRKACTSGGHLAEVDLTADTFKAACVSVDLSVQAATNGDFAITRPPGHHASSSNEMGFCLFNNIAIATKYLLDQGKKVLIIDIDGHHGNGTQEIILKSKNILYFSIHQENTFPYTANEPNILTNGGEIRAINMTTSEGSGDDVLLEAIKFAISTKELFNFDVIGVSAGFDGYHSDRLLNLNYTEIGYYNIGKMLHDMKVDVFAVLEGGYHNHIPDCIESFIAGIEGRASSIDLKPSISNEKTKKQFNSSLERIKELYMKFQ